MISRTRLAAVRFVRDHGRAAGRYAVVGLSGYLLSVAIFAALVGAGVSPYVAVPPGFLANTAWNFTLNRLWSFPGTSNAWSHDLGRFSVVAFATLVANYGVLALLHSVLGVPSVIAQAVAILAITPIGYAGQRYWAFAAR